MIDAEQFNADQLAFWNGHGGQTWVQRQEHTDITLARVSEALLAFAAPASIRDALAAHVDASRVRLPGAMWLVSSAPA